MHELELASAPPPHYNLILCENMLECLSADIFCSEKRTSEQMFLEIFFATLGALKIGEYSNVKRGNGIADTYSVGQYYGYDFVFLSSVVVMKTSSCDRVKKA